MMFIEITCPIRGPGDWYIYRNLQPQKINYMDVSKNRGIFPPKWMVKIMEHPYFLMDDLGVPLFLETPI